MLRLSAIYRHRSCLLTTLQKRGLKLSITKYQHEQQWKGLDSKKLLSSDTPDDEFVYKEDKLLTVPNLLSASRIIAGPYLGYLTLHSSPENFDMICAGILLFGISD